MRNLDDLTIYLFVRADLTEEDQLVQSNHAMFALANAMHASGPHTGIPRVIALDGGSSVKAFEKLQRKLMTVCGFVTFEDPDKPEWGVTAMATLPLTKEKSLPLRNYRLRRYSPVAQLQSNASPCDGVAGVGGANPSGRASLPCSGSSA